MAETETRPDVSAARCAIHQSSASKPPPSCPVLEAGRSNPLLRRQPVTVCEVGFNLGHSAVAFLSAIGPAGRYVGFEFGGRFVSAAAALVNGSSLFPGQVELVMGDSLTSVPTFLAARPSFKCDLLSIDGDHRIEYVTADWRSFKRRLAPDHVALLDDVQFWHVLFRRSKWYDPEAHPVGCLSLPGHADDDESIELYATQRLRGRNVTGTMIASDGFCVARRTLVWEQNASWRWTHTAGAVKGEAMHLNERAADPYNRAPGRPIVARSPKQLGSSRVRIGQRDGAPAPGLLNGSSR